MSKIICVFGTSITWGACDYEKGGWVERLRLFADKNFDDTQVYNLGISGDTSENILIRFEAEAKARNPEIIIFDMGANDSALVKSLAENRVILEKYKKNLERLAAKAKKITNKIVFVGLTPTDEKIVTPAPWATDIYYYFNNAREYNEAVKEFCQKEKVDFIDIFNTVNDDDLDDGLHPNAEGHEKIFQRVKDYLIKNKII